MADRQEPLEQADSAVDLAQLHQRPEHPDRRVGVLPPVLPDAGRVGADVAGVLGRAGERRCQEKDQPFVLVHQVSQHRLHRSHGSRPVRR